jgi:hypothetical protein
MQGQALGLFSPGNATGCEWIQRKDTRLDTKLRLGGAKASVKQWICVVGMRRARSTIAVGV